MSAGGNVAPVIIKKKKVVGGDGHHGGAWKVAYADFVTAMMAFFMLMWLLNATTEKQRKGIADYFSPTVAFSRVSGGGSGMLGGNSVFTEQTLSQNGTGASSQFPTAANRARGDTGVSDTGNSGESDAVDMSRIEDALYGRGGESMVQENALRHVILKSTDEGLVIELFELPDSRLFDDAGIPTAVLVDLAHAVKEAAKLVTNPVAIEGHVPTRPIVVANDNRWEDSVSRAQIFRQLVTELSMPADRISRVTGHADRELADENPLSLRNSRLEIVFLREQE